MVFREGVESYLNDYIETGKISRDEANLISLFLFERQSQRGITPQTALARCSEILAATRCLHDAGGELVALTNQDVLRAVAGIRAAGFTQNYTHRSLQTFKSFLLWYSENGADLNEKKIRGIKTPGMDWKTKKPEDLLTIEEVERTMDACTSSRDRAIISFLYDGAFRPSEIVGILWKDLEFDDYGIKMEFKTPKTGFTRQIRFTYAVPFLKTWKDDYPLDLAPTSPVFLQTKKHSLEYIPLTYNGVAMLLRRLKKSTGIQKLRPGIFRPTNITHDAEEGTDHTYLMLKNFGHMRTQMLAVYVRPNKEYIDRVALEKAGIKLKVEPRKKRVSLKPIQCPECKTLNPASATYCMTCTTGLTEETRNYVREMKKSDKENIDLYLPLLQKLKEAEDRGLDFSKLISGSTLLPDDTGTTPTRDTQDRST